MVTISVRILSSFKDKTVGLLGSKKAYPIFFQTHFGIHTFGMHYAIDVLILDKENTIQKLHRGLKPNKLFFWNPSFDKVVELPHGMIAELGLHEGMRIMLQSF